MRSSNLFSAEQKEKQTKNATLEKLQKETAELTKTHNDVVKQLWKAQQEIIKLKASDSPDTTAIKSKEELEAALQKCLKDTRSSELIDENLKKIKELETDLKITSHRI